MQRFGMNTFASSEAIATLTDEVTPYKIGNRTDSAALMAWFLEVVWHLDEAEVADIICDGSGDKGIDALYVDKDDAEIYVFQSKWRKDPSKSTQGDKELREFVGTAAYFDSLEAFEALLAAGPNLELRQLLIRQDVRQFIESTEYTVKLVFVTNGELDGSGKDYAAAVTNAVPPLKVHVGSHLADIAERTRRPALLTAEIPLVGESEPIISALTSSERMAITLISANQLVKLPGIADQSLFSRNVRLSAGKTKINEALKTTVINSGEHRMFPAFHNGLTLLTDHFDAEGSTLKLHGIGVVNGCQSLTTLFENAGSLTDSLRLLVKIVEVPEDGQVADNITYRSNNQNAVTLRDQRSNDRALRSLQEEVRKNYGNELFFKIKLGEKAPNGTRVLENTNAAQLIMAVYLSEPSSAVRKLRLFDEDFRRIFDRRMTAPKLYLLDMMDSVITEARANLSAELISSFAAIKYTLLHLVAQVLRLNENGSLLLESPELWLGTEAVKTEMRASLMEISREVVDSANDFVAEQSEEDELFDPKVSFKSQVGVKKIGTFVARDARRSERKNDSYLFSVSPTSLVDRKA